MRSHADAAGRRQGAAKPPRREAAGKAKPKNDRLEKAQLAIWFKQVQAITNPVIAAYLQVMLFTGARREELGELTWGDVDFR